MAIPAAAGYQQYSGNIITPEFSEKILENFQCRTIYHEISTTEYSGTLEKMGDELVFFHEPDININPYEKGGQIINQNITMSPIKMLIDKAFSFGVAFDRIDMKQIQNFERIKERILVRAPYNLSVNIDTQLLANMYADVDPNNAGANAGVKSGSFNLGVTGNPVTVSSTNIIQVLTDVQSVLDEQCIPPDDRFIVLPVLGKNALLNSDLRAAYFAGTGESQVLNGRLPNTVAGFTVYISNFLPQVFDAAVSANCYQIVAGAKMATGFASQIDEVRYREFDNTFGAAIQGLAVYGHKVLYNKALAGLYARFN